MDTFYKTQLVQFGKITVYNCKEVFLQFYKNEIFVVIFKYKKGLIEIRIDKNQRKKDKQENLENI